MGTSGDETKTSKDKEVTFVRPPYSKEVLNEDGRKKFDELPGSHRHLIKRLLEHGNLELALKEAGIAKQLREMIDVPERDFNEVVSHAGLSTSDLGVYFRDCVEANSVRFDKHGNPVSFVNLDLRLKALGLAFEYLGYKKEQPTKKEKTAVDLFEDTKLE